MYRALANLKGAPQVQKILAIVAIPFLALVLAITTSTYLLVQELNAMKAEYRIKIQQADAKLDLGFQTIVTTDERLTASLVEARSDFSGETTRLTQNLQEADGRLSKANEILSTDLGIVRAELRDASEIQSQANASLREDINLTQGVISQILLRFHYTDPFTQNVYWEHVFRNHYTADAAAWAVWAFDNDMTRFEWMGKQGPSYWYLDDYPLELLRYAATSTFVSRESVIDMAARFQRHLENAPASFPSKLRQVYLDEIAKIVSSV